MAYHNKEFIKEKDGITAPKGFHYMPNGKLMSDADHIAMHGYIEKEITSFSINTKDINYLGENRSFSILGNGIFSLEISDADSNYYNFNTQTWSTSKSGLYRIELLREYSSSIVFGTAAKGHVYTINLFAEIADNIKTKHAARIEVRNADGSINVNKSTGSNSDLLKRIIYQDLKKNLYLSCIAPSLTNTSADVTVGSVSGNIIHTTVASPLDKIAIGDKVTGTGALTGNHILVTAIDPNNNDPNEVEVNQTCSIGSGVTLTYTPAFAGMTPNGTVNTTGRQAFEVSSGGSLKRNFSITCTALAGRTFSVSRLPTVNDLCAYTTVTFESAALAIEGEDTSSSTLYYRWPITNIAKLQSGMVLDPARTDGNGAIGVNTTTPAIISKYLTTKTNLELVERKHYTDVNSVTVEDISVDGVDNYGNDVTAIDRNGIITAQKGNIIFNVQQLDALKADASVRIFGYGADKIKSLTGMEVALSNVVITPTQISTTTTGAVSASATIPVTNTDHISTASTIRGVGISTSAANPTVSFKATATGAANLTASAAQTLESGQTLYFDGASNILTITGDIEISNMSISDTTLYLDVEKFIRVG